jgi:hypothetical protein
MVEPMLIAVRRLGAPKRLAMLRFCNAGAAHPIAPNISLAYFGRAAGTQDWAAAQWGTIST